MSIDSQINQCASYIEYYRVLKNQLNSILDYLSNSKNNITDLNGKILNLYQVNDEGTNISNRILNLNDNIQVTCDNLRNKVIPSIDSMISNLNNQKFDLETKKNNSKSNN